MLARRRCFFRSFAWGTSSLAGIAPVAIHRTPLTFYGFSKHTSRVTSPATSQEAAVLDLARQRPLLRARDLVAASLPTIVLSRLVKAGKLERATRGVYTLPGRRLTEHSSLAEVCLRVPNAVVCLMSALRFHGVGTQAPFDVWIALPLKAREPRLDSPRVRVVRMSDAGLREGVQTKLIEGVTVRVSNLPKTVVDCFKFRNKIGIDVALEALHHTWGDGMLSMSSIDKYARAAKMSNVMRPYLQSTISK
jgi:hypothetical protein